MLGILNIQIISDILPAIGRKLIVAKPLKTDMDLK